MGGITPTITATGGSEGKKNEKGEKRGSENTTNKIGESREIPRFTIRTSVKGHKVQSSKTSYSET